MTSPFPSDCLDSFEPGERIAAGGFGAVYRATHRRLGRTAAVKLLLDTTVNDAELVARFMAEARITAGLVHPNIVSVIDHGHKTGVPWIAYEYLDGPTLRQTLDRGPMQTEAAVVCLIQVAEALRMAHDHGVLHRDVKPENVIEVSPGQWKVMDFGIAKWTDAAAVHTKTGIVLGTPDYMAPEQILGLPVTPATDVYAAGALLFELLTGRPPFLAASPMETLEAHLHQDPPRPSVLAPSVSPALDHVVRQALSKTLPPRIPTALALIEALERCATLGTDSPRGTANTDRSVPKPTSQIGRDRTAPQGRPERPGSSGVTSRRPSQPVVRDRHETKVSPEGWSAPSPWPQRKIAVAMALGGIILVGALGVLDSRENRTSIPSLPASQAPSVSIERAHAMLKSGSMSPLTGPELASLATALEQQFDRIAARSGPLMTLGPGESADSKSVRDRIVNGTDDLARQAADLWSETKENSLPLAVDVAFRDAASTLIAGRTALALPTPAALESIGSDSWVGQTLRALRSRLTNMPGEPEARRLALEAFDRRWLPGGLEEAPPAQVDGLIARVRLELIAGFLSSDRGDALATTKTITLGAPRRMLVWLQRFRDAAIRIEGLRPFLRACVTAWQRDVARLLSRTELLAESARQRTPATKSALFDLQGTETEKRLSYFRSMTTGDPVYIELQRDAAGLRDVWLGCLTFLGEADLDPHESYAFGSHTGEFLKSIYSLSRIDKAWLVKQERQWAEPLKDTMVFHEIRGAYPTIAGHKAPKLDALDCVRASLEAELRRRPPVPDGVTGTYDDAFIAQAQIAERLMVTTQSSDKARHRIERKLASELLRRGESDPHLTDKARPFFATLRKRIDQ